MYRMKIYYYMTLWLTFLGLASACSSEADEVTVPETTSVSFHVAGNTGSTSSGSKSLYCQALSL